jgi:glycyl-tRNA synthetase alpha chain
MNLQNLIIELDKFWSDNGCIIRQPYDMEVGAGTYHPATFFGALQDKKYRAAYVQPSRRPTDGRYGESPNRVHRFLQYQVILKPSPKNIQELYIQSLSKIGIDVNKHDIRFIKDDWESPTLGAWGVGWEVWLDGMEITQFTYFQQVGGISLKQIPGEITYGIERLAMYLQEKNNIFDVQYNDTTTYGDLYKKNEYEYSKYNFELSNVKLLFESFDNYESEFYRMVENGLIIPSYEFIMKAAHMFNLLDARNSISVTERQDYIRRIRNMSKRVAKEFLKKGEENE